VRRLSLSLIGVVAVIVGGPAQPEVGVRVARYSLG